MGGWILGVGMGGCVGIGCGFGRACGDGVHMGVVCGCVHTESTKM